ncbi:hypothetical protein AcW1_002590 [Taiwanofungus camphoratus]|nr:hypothetical protein AcW1_002590 [Antrodia cinnamomea]
MTTTKDTVASYAASCNPPRRAKRPRTNSADAAGVTMQDATANGKPPSRRPRPPILPKEPVLDHTSELAEDADSDSAEEDDYDPSLKSSSPKRRGRKPGALSRSARESLRKLNHSRIEKARRTKINETLATLSALVNEAECQKQGGSVESAQEFGNAGKNPGGASKQSTKGKTEEKEFKLDVLVKTVGYMQELIEKVKMLESTKCVNCSQSAAASPSSLVGAKRKRTLDEDSMDLDIEPVQSSRDENESYVGDDEKGQVDDAEFPSPTPALSATSAQRSVSPRLPSIASWLPHPYVDPSCIVALSDSLPPASGSHLPSPPLSGHFRPINSVSNVPSLTLPSPAHPGASSANSRPSPPVSADSAQSTVSRIAIPISAITTRGRSVEARTRRASCSSGSAAWTPEDESAASLLLQMSSSPSSAPSMSSAVVSALTLPKALDMSSQSPQTVDSRGGRATPSVQAQTPSSLLGLDREV